MCVGLAMFQLIILNLPKPKKEEEEINEIIEKSKKLAKPLFYLS
ncbi:hypothetical protein LCGC14_1094930 [marine sediment metagenome]|uniref:Uncharacterized protein n=1 Tax=marine sediment metagenome TaxID=412755 RepID=A0A0F9MB89_9ZZZZ